MPAQIWQVLDTPEAHLGLIPATHVSVAFTQRDTKTGIEGGGSAKQQPFVGKFHLQHLGQTVDR